MRHEAQIATPVAALISPAVAARWAKDFPRWKEMDPVTILRWISRTGGPRLLGLSDGAEATLVLHVGVDDERGRPILQHSGPGDPPVGDQLARVGLTPADMAIGGGADAGEVTIEQATLARVLAFAIVPVTEAPTNTLGMGSDGPRLPRLDPATIPLDIYSSSLIGLEHPDHGAPLEAVWHITWELSGVHYCILNGDLDVEAVERIPYRQHLSSDQFADAMEACRHAGLAGAHLPLFVATSPGQGHCVYVGAIDARQLSYMDPWPGRSLLAPENNTFGVVARHLDEARKNWRISRDEFVRVGYATLVQPEVWTQLCGVDPVMRYSEIANSSFFGFFNMRETARTPSGDEIEICVAPGKWREHIDLRFVVGPEDAVLSATLQIARVWIDDPPARPFAFDLLKSFIEATLPPADADEGALLVQALWAVPRGQAGRALEAGPAHLLPQIRLAVLAVLGKVPFGRVMLPCSTIRIHSDDDGNDARVRVEVSCPFGKVGPLLEDVESGYQMDAYRAQLWSDAMRQLQRR